METFLGSLLLKTVLTRDIGVDFRQLLGWACEVHSDTWLDEKQENKLFLYYYSQRVFKSLLRNFSLESILYLLDDCFVRRDKSRGQNSCDLSYPHQQGFFTFKFDKPEKLLCQCSTSSFFKGTSPLSKVKKNQQGVRMIIIIIRQVSTAIRDASLSLMILGNWGLPWIWEQAYSFHIVWEVAGLCISNHRGKPRGGRENLLLLFSHSS